MAGDKGLTVIVDSRKSSSSELCFSALKAFKVKWCCVCVLGAEMCFAFILNLFCVSVYGFVCV